MNPRQSATRTGRKSQMLPPVAEASRRQVRLHLLSNLHCQDVPTLSYCSLPKNTPSIQPAASLQVQRLMHLSQSSDSFDLLLACKLSPQKFQAINCFRILQVGVIGSGVKKIHSIHLKTPLFFNRSLVNSSMSSRLVSLGLGLKKIASAFIPNSVVHRPYIMP